MSVVHCSVSSRLLRDLNTISYVGLHVGIHNFLNNGNQP